MSKAKSKSNEYIKFWCIWSVDENRVMGNTQNLICHDKSKVISEAKRLASENPRTEYTILEAISTFVTKLPDVTETELTIKES